MMYIQPTRRRGVALLLVLGALITATTVAAILATTAAEVNWQRQLVRSEAIAFDFLSAMEDPIQHWLDYASPKVVLPPDNLLPAVVVLNDQINVDGTSVGVRITAFDQLGMVPLQVAGSASPLRLSLPPEICELIDATDLPAISDDKPLGLDLLMPIHDRRKGPAASAFPTDSSPAVGGLVATHNCGRVRININTAPRQLLEAALRVAGRGDLKRIITLRAESKSASIESSSRRAGPADGRDDFAPEVVTSSACWAFRIDIDAGTLRRSWWAIYQRGNDDPHTARRERWRCVQRLAITI